jgi:transposase
MVGFRIALTEDERRVVNAERDAHPEAHVRRKMLVVWLLHCGLTRAKAAEIGGLSRATVQRYVAAYRAGGLDGLRRWGIRDPVSDLVAHTTAIREALTNQPVRTAAEAAERIERLTGLTRKPT